ncbi:ATP-binding protein [Methylobacillus glycogenes]|uniref:ATP-binding protein n=1 Tax=Methylobacillus glycogenes TaxID=406 RepID=UPI00046EF481|nr:ATP-binding protein [Methylobacillus glycogenes]
MSMRILNVSVKSELDVVVARQRTREIANLIGFSMQDQTRVSTAVSELARNLFNYAGGGTVEFSIEGETAPQLFVVTISDNGPGIPHIQDVLSGNYHSPSGMGLGIIGARRLMDRFDIATSAQGTVITLAKLLPGDVAILTKLELGKLTSGLSMLRADLSLAELEQQNRELLTALAELKARQDELTQLTRELEDTNRGVVALYAELEEQADHLRRADEMKSRFLSNMSHEFRTPLNSIRALSKLLLDKVDGELNDEQMKQVGYIQSGASALSELVNDLLDIAKIEAGKVELHIDEFNVSDTFSALRGMLKPLLVYNKLSLVFNEQTPSLSMVSDEAKVSQILRNFISNALKFTEQGSITVSAQQQAENKLLFAVSDSGIGIDAAHFDTIFEEFSQVENPLQRGVKGTGLGLPLCRKLATLLGGRVYVESTPGLGSTFYLELPINRHLAQQQAEIPVLQANKKAVLVVEDNPAQVVIYQKFLEESEFHAVQARNLREADLLWPEIEPVAVILDIFLKGETSWQWLSHIKNDALRQHVPIIVATEVEDRRKGLALGADAYYIKPLIQDELLLTLRTVTS